MNKGIELGVKLINDVSGLSYDSKTVGVLKKNKNTNKKKKTKNKPEKNKKNQKKKNSICNSTFTRHTGKNAKKSKI